MVTKQIFEEIKKVTKSKDVNIEGSSETPEVILKKNDGEIKFRGRSMPEDAKGFYNPIIEWIEQYSECPAPGTHVVFSYEYFNTASSKMIMEVLEAVKKIGNKDKQLKTEWHYFIDDEDILEAGEDYEEMTGISFDYLSYE
jgi:hypothetical protein